MKNLLRNFWLTLSRFKTASILNILGLTVAFAVFTIIMAQTYWELSYNKKMKDHERVFRLYHNLHGEFYCNISRPLGEAIGNATPAIEAYTVLSQSGEATVSTLEINGQVKESKTPFTQASLSVTEMLALECLSGDFKRLAEPKAAIIPKSLAEVLFADTEPVGNVLCISRYSGNDTLNVVAVYKDLPKNCTFKNGIYSIMGEDGANNKSNWSFIYYYKLNDPAAKPEVEEYAKKILQEYKAEGKDSDDEDDDEEDVMGCFLDPFSNLYFSEVKTFADNTGNKMFTNLLTITAIIIILIAIINYINFFMALVPVRVRAVNINKVFGTPTSALRLNVIGEAVGILLLAFGLALLLIQYLSGTFINDLTIISFNLEENFFIITMIGILTVVICILVGLFTAFYITKFNPAIALKGFFGRSRQGQRLRSFLVGFQFTTSILLIIVSSFVFLQNRYMQKYDYGFHRDRLLTVDVGQKISSEYHTFTTELRKNPAIEDIAYAIYPLVGTKNSWGRPYNGESISFSYIAVSWNYPEFMGIKLIEGRYFIEEDDSKSGGTIIFNETAAKKYNIKVGDFIYGHNWREDAEIVGIVKDFNFNSLQNNIEPLALYQYGKYGWQTPSFAHVRLAPNADYKQTADFITSTIKAIDPTIGEDKISITPFDMSVENLYTKETKLAKIISLFSIVAIIISLMGVFGIVVFENQHRKKEIAIRKIHGSTAALILGMFNRKFIIILLICFVIAAPIAGFGVAKWLAGFAYRIPLYWWVFVGGFLVVASITLLTVTLQTFRSANENPAKFIKND